MKIKDLVVIALFAALMGIVAPLALPIGEVPVSLATFIIMLSSLFLGAKRGFYATLIYIIIGCLGLPVFASYKGGLGVILGATGGYILGYLPLAICAGLKGKSSLETILGMILGIILCYLWGTIWFCAVMNVGFIYALSICVIPFIIPDLMKIIMALFCFRMLSKVVRI